MADFSKAQTQNDVDELKKIKKKLEASNDENVFRFHVHRAWLTAYRMNSS